MFLINNYDNLGIINIGTGIDITIKELAQLVAKIVDYNGKFSYDLNMPDGTMRKLLDTNKINNLGWQSKIKLIDGLRKTILEFKKHYFV